MKYIQKSGSPYSYSQWCAQVAGTDKSDWREVPSDQKEQVLEAMVAEQGGLCAYTMRRIDQNSSHVEHIKPQSRCREDLPGSDLGYTNLVACFPRDGMKPQYRYGAQRKGNWWDNDGAEFVSPLQPACEQVFRFKLDGEIEAIDNRIEAFTTIEVLALDHTSLTEDRKRVIEEFIYGRTGDAPLSSAAALRARDTICARKRNGLFYEFCVALRAALEEHIAILKKLRQRRRYARRSR